jgi:signal transduction histidine kinase
MTLFLLALAVVAMEWVGVSRPARGAHIKGHSVAMQLLAPEELIQDAMMLAHAEAVARHVILQGEIGPDLPLIAADRVHISRALRNLIINGIDAIESCRLTDRVLVIEARRRDRHTLEITVTDSGSGVGSAQPVDRMLESFFTPSSQDTGKGLAVSRTIIEAHGGRLWVQASTRGMGLTFHFTLPLARNGGP